MQHQSACKAFDMTHAVAAPAVGHVTPRPTSSSRLWSEVVASTLLIYSCDIQQEGALVPELPAHEAPALNLLHPSPLNTITVLKRTTN